MPAVICQDVRCGPPRGEMYPKPICGPLPAASDLEEQLVGLLPVTGSSMRTTEFGRVCQGADHGPRRLRFIHCVGHRMSADRGVLVTSAATTALQLVHRQQLDRRQPDPYQGLQDLAAPALAFHEGKLHLLLAGTDRRLWHTAYYNGAWGPATALTFKFGGAKRRHALRVRGINGPP